MSKFSNHIWYSVETDGNPPFDTQVLVRSKHPKYNFWRYAIAFNNCYRPDVSMSQILELSEDLRSKLPVYVGLAWEIEEWMILEM